MIKKFLALCAALAFCAAAPVHAEEPAPVSATEQRAAELFAARDWTALDALVEGQPNLTPRALSLAANALWYQKKYDKALALMERVGENYPARVAPYAKLLSALALERIGRRTEAYKTALDLWLDAGAPKLAKYYAMYALVRLTSSVDEKEKWLRRMLTVYDDSTRSASVARELIAIGRLKPDGAYALLRSEPQNADALKVIAAAPDTPQKHYRLGYAAYLRGDYKKAVSLLGKVKLNGPYGESSCYYRCVSLQKLERSLEAEPLLEKLILKKNSDFIIRGLSRLRLMLGGKAHAKALAFLRKMSRGTNRQIAEEALYALAVGSWEKAGASREEYLRRFPGGRYANTLRWTRGWIRLQNNNPRGALEAWRGADDSSPQLLYWRAAAHEKLGQKKQAQALRDQLLKKHAFTVYAFLTQPEGSLEVTDAPLPEKLTPAPPSDLEQWGFMTHAHMRLEGVKNTRYRARRALLAAWLGSEWQAYGDLRSAAESLAAGTSVPRSVLELLYPRPFRATVEEAAKRYGVDPLFIWSIMKQESGFNPAVSSWVGAAGLMQLMPATAAGEAKKMGLRKYSLYGVRDNVNMGAHHIAGLIAAYKNLDWTAAAYNAGGGNVNKWNRLRGTWPIDAWIESVPFGETKGYVKNVLRNYAVYTKLYGKPGPAQFRPANSGK